MDNIIDITSNNLFLKKLYPNGFDFFVGQLNFNIADRVTFILHSKTKPDIEIPKWGIWGENYNIITIELLGQFINKANVINWQNNVCEICICTISTLNNCYLINFTGTNWKIELELQSLTFQRNSTYIID